MVLNTCKHYLRMSRRKQQKIMRRNITKTGKLLGAWVPEDVFDGVLKWIKRDPERDKSTFLRQASREFLRKEGIRYEEETV